MDQACVGDIRRTRRRLLKEHGYPPGRNPLASPVAPAQPACFERLTQACSCRAFSGEAALGAWGAAMTNEWEAAAAQPRGPAADYAAGPAPPWTQPTTSTRRASRPKRRVACHTSLLNPAHARALMRARCCSSSVNSACSTTACCLGLHCARTAFLPPAGSSCRLELGAELPRQDPGRMLGCALHTLPAAAPC